jgi:hypothetical protein
MSDDPFSVEDLQVNSDIFPANRWREGMIEFLMRIWSGDSPRNPHIRIRDIVLRRDEETSRFKIEGPRQVVSGVEGFTNSMMFINDETFAIEAGLIRFVKNDSIRCLGIHFENEKRVLWFWKGHRRGELNCGLHSERW